MTQQDWTTSLVKLFYPLVEVTLFDQTGKFLNALNSFSSLKEDQELDVKKCGLDQVFTERLAIGKNVKSLVRYFNTGYARIRYDLTLFMNLQDQLDFLIQPTCKQFVIEPWKTQVDQMINAFLIENQINLQALSVKQKRELVSELQVKGLLDFKESTSYLASKLQTSRATIYNYLKTASNFKKIQVHQVDAFTHERFGGNPAGVVLEADGLDETVMRKIARELNLSETAFVLSSDKGSFQMRYFTPTGHEVAFCGHSSVGALYMIAKEKLFGIKGVGHHPFTVETKCGVLNMETRIDDEEEIQVAYEVPTTKLKPCQIDHLEVAKAGGFDENFINLSFPVMYEETNKSLFLFINSLEALKNIECNPKALTHFSKLHNIVSVCLFTSETFDSKNQFHMRCYAPLVGVTEDPFTGSVLGGLAAYVDVFKLIHRDVCSFRVEQGHFLNRPGAVKVDFLKKGKTHHAKVYAQAVHCFSTEINLI